MKKQYIKGKTRWPESRIKSIRPEQKELNETHAAIIASVSKEQPPYLAKTPADIELWAKLFALMILGSIVGNTLYDFFYPIVASL